MGRHRKNTHSVLWDYVTIWAGPLIGAMGLITSFIL